MGFQIVTGNRRREMNRAGCPCGDGEATRRNPPRRSLVMQLSTLGDARRVRAAAITIRLCEKCIRLIHTKDGRRARRALANALQHAAVELARKVKSAA